MAFARVRRGLAGFSGESTGAAPSGTAGPPFRGAPTPDETSYETDRLAPRADSARRARNALRARAMWLRTVEGLQSIAAATSRTGNSSISRRTNAARCCGDRSRDSSSQRAWTSRHRTRFDGSAARRSFHPAFRRLGRLRRRDGVLALAPPAVDRPVRRDPPQPRVDGETRPVPAAVSPQRNERLLHHVLGQRRIAEDLVGDEVDAPIFEFVQLAKCRAVTRGRASNQVGVANSRRVAHSPPAATSEASASALAASDFLPKTIFPAEVCSTDVTSSCTVSPRWSRAPSTTTIVPSSR